jgi:hypothetical protein
LGKCSYVLENYSSYKKFGKEQLHCAIQHVLHRPAAGGKLELGICFIEEADS